MNDPRAPRGADISVEDLVSRSLEAIARSWLLMASTNRLVGPPQRPDLGAPLAPPFEEPS